MFECIMAFRYLRARRQEGFISVIAWFSLLGITLGVATLIIVMSVMNGFREELLTRILGLNGHITINGPSEKLFSSKSLIPKIKPIQGITSITQMIEGQVMVTARGVAQGAVVRAISEKALKNRKIISNNIQKGDLKNFGTTNNLLIGDRLARKLGVTIGDPITLISPKGLITAFGTVPRMKTYKIAATFEVGMYEYDSNFIFMPIAAGKTYFKMPNSITHLEIFLKNSQETPKIIKQLNKNLGANYRIYDWQQANAGFFNAIKVERNVMFLILTLIIIVAAFNIISSMIMLVKDKNQDIAIIRTMGATQNSIMRIFFLVGASIGIIGTMLGLLIGVSFANNIETIRQFIQNLTGGELFAAEIYFLSQLPAIVNTSEVVTIVTMALILSLLATIYPAWKAARLDPAEALRYG